MGNSKGIIPEPLNIRKQDETVSEKTRTQNGKVEEKVLIRDPGKSPKSDLPRGSGRGCLPCYYIHERCSLRDTPTIPCTRCKQKALECVMYPSPNGPRDLEKGFTSPRSPESKTRETSDIVKTPTVRPKGPRPRHDWGEDEHA